MPIKLIPQDPYFVPSAEAIETVKLLMEGLAEGIQSVPWQSSKQEVVADVITVQHCIWEKPRFVTLDEEYSQQVTCPACGEILELPDEEDEEETGEKMTGWKLKQQLLGSEDVMQLKIKMPCCNTEIAVTSIDFSDGGGFSRFVLSLEDDCSDFSEADILLFEKILGCKLTQIYW